MGKSIAGTEKQGDSGQHQQYHDAFFPEVLLVEQQTSCNAGYYRVAAANGLDDGNKCVQVGKGMKINEIGAGESKADGHNRQWRIQSCVLPPVSEMNQYKDGKQKYRHVD
jgi:hypothetical protein